MVTKKKIPPWIHHFQGTTRSCLHFPLECVVMVTLEREIWGQTFHGWDTAWGHLWGCRQAHPILRSCFKSEHLWQTRGPSKTRKHKFWGGAPSAYGTLLHLEEERINSSQSVVYDGVILAWQFWVKDTEIKM